MGTPIQAWEGKTREEETLWNAVREEWGQRTRTAPTTHNLSINHDGVIKARLSTFQLKSANLNQHEAAELATLDDKRPAQLVMLRNERRLLLKHAGLGSQSPWTVDPALLTAIRAAMDTYHADRAPLYALGETQRLGYLDEEDFIVCRSPLDARPSTHFEAGVRYPISAKTVTVSRSGRRANLMGEDEDLLFAGQELVIFVGGKGMTPGDQTPAAGACVAFVDARALAPGVNIEALTGHCVRPLQDLIAHFAIPEVPDVAQRNPTRYTELKTRLAALELAMA